MKFSGKITFWAGVITVYAIVLAGIFTGTYYGTRLPIGMLTQYNAPAQAR